jgi:hypothetical protein
MVRVQLIERLGTDLHVGTDVPNPNQNAWLSNAFAELYVMLKCSFHVITSAWIIIGV